jgi:uncharacterized surface protein with fasciclin (FAS1) repeats
MAACACCAGWCADAHAALGRQAALAERLSRGSAFTVFAPTDAAFAATLDALGVSKASLMASGELLNVLMRMHVVGSKVRSCDACR